MERNQTNIPKKILIKNIRRIFRNSKLRYSIIKRSRVIRGIYECEQCKRDFKSKNIVVDHINPVVDPKKGFTDWNDYISRMFPPNDQLQAICKPCHDKKTQKENIIRKRSKRLKK